MTLEVRGFQLIERGALATVWAAFEEDGEPKDLSELATPPTVTITRGDGELLTENEPANLSETIGRLEYHLPPSKTLELDELAIDWTLNLGTEQEPIPVTFRTRAEILGTHLFTIGEARRFDKEQAKDAPTERIDAMRAQITDDFAQIAGVEFVPRCRRVVLDGSGTADLWLPNVWLQRVMAVEVRNSAGDWDAWDSADVGALEIERHGQVWRPVGRVWPRGRRNLRVTYIHGYARAPHEVKTAALTLLTYEINPSNLSERALSFSDDTGTFRLAAPGERGRWYGLPYVDAVLDRYSEHIPRIG